MKLLRLPRLRSVFREDKKEKLELNLPMVRPEKLFLAIENITKEDLIMLISPLTPYFENKELVFTPESDSKICADLMQQTNPKRKDKSLKNSMLHIYASYASDLENLYYTVCRDETMTKGWRKILDMATVDSATLHTIFGREVKVSAPLTPNVPGLTECLFNPLRVVDPRVLGNPGDKDVPRMTQLSLYPATRRQLAQLFIKPEAVDPSVMSVLPAGANLAVESFEGNIPVDLAYLTALDLMNKGMAQGADTLTPARLKAIKKNFETPGFLPSDIGYPVDRVEMLTVAYSLIDRKAGSCIKTADFARAVFENIPRMISGVVFDIFLPAFKGFSKTWAVNDNVPDIIKLTTLLLMPATKGWMSLHNLRLRYLCHVLPGYDKVFYMPLFSPGSLSAHTLKRKSDDGKLSSRSFSIDWFGEVTFPFIVHWIKFLCALGMVDIAVDRAQLDNPDDPLEAMRYIKVNALGKYAFGLEKRYVSPVMDLDRMLEIDDRNGIITVLKDKCPYLPYLKQITEPIADRRFRITPRTMLMNAPCRKAAELTLSSLGNIIDLPRYPNLKAAVDEALKRSCCSEPVKGEYRIIKIKPDIPGLVSFIAGEPQIRKECFLGENGMILVPQKFVDTFTEICRSNGYLLAEE